jgi:hypothetical protein
VLAARAAVLPFALESRLSLAFFTLAFGETRIFAVPTVLRGGRVHTASDVVANFYVIEKLRERMGMSSTTS